MELTSGQYIQLIAVLMLGLLMFIGAYSLKEKTLINFLVVSIPFQPVSSSFGSINMVLVYLVATVFILRKKIILYPMAPWIIVILFTYFIATVVAPAYSRFDNIIYIVSILSGFLFFFMVFNYVYKTGDIRSVIRTLTVSNILVALYCLAQLTIGLEHFAVFGIEEFSLQENRADGRLLGPFNAAGITAEYLLVQIFILIYQHMFDKKIVWRRISLSLIPINLALLIMTGNRTAVVVLFIAGILFAYLFRKRLGMKKIIIGSTLTLLTFLIVSVIVVNFSQFNVLFDRFANTEVSEDNLDSRSKIWPYTWEKIMEKPILGHGPRIRLIGESLGTRQFPSGYEYMPYPHSMYLFFWYTLGIVGLLAYLGFFFRLFIFYLNGMKNRAKDNFVRFSPMLAVLLWFSIMLDQGKVSAFRFSLLDYQHYIFVIFGTFLGIVFYLRKINTGNS